jgi:hypothetical protein
MSLDIAKNFSCRSPEDCRLFVTPADMRIPATDVWKSARQYSGKQSGICPL